MTGSKPPFPHAIAFNQEQLAREKVYNKRRIKTVTERENTTQNSRANKGGRPKKQEHLDQKVTVMFTRMEVITVRFFAKEMRLTVSEYLRSLGLKRQVDRQVKVLPREVLQLAGTLNHMAANINQVALKRNRGDELNAIERAELMVLSGEIKDLARTLKAALK